MRSPDSIVQVGLGCDLFVMMRVERDIYRRREGRHEINVNDKESRQI